MTDDSWLDDVLEEIKQRRQRFDRPAYPGKLVVTTPGHVGKYDTGHFFDHYSRPMKLLAVAPREAVYRITGSEGEMYVDRLSTMRSRWARKNASNRRQRYAMQRAFNAGQFDVIARLPVRQSVTHHFWAWSMTVTRIR